MNKKLNIRVSDQSSLDYVLSKVQCHTHKVKLGRTFTQKEIPYWECMPEFKQVKQEAFAHVTVDVSDIDVSVLSSMFEQPITEKTKSIWYPKLVKRERGKWLSHSSVKNKYPIYIISKGRAKCMTARALDKMNVDYSIVIEPCDFDDYKEFNDVNKLIVTDFENLGQGSIPVRNFVWEHSISNGCDWHWVLDDNIEDFNILFENTKDVIRSPSCFRYVEDFVSLYDNVGQAGFNYYNFCKATDAVPPYYTNTRIYSCILIRNDIPFRWRGKYNEDTDLSIRILKSGMCTILFNMFLAGKVTTLRMKGGNTDNVYTDGDNRYKFAESLHLQHPDIVKITTKFGRFHHHVDYSGFKQELNRVRDHSYDYTNDLFWSEFN